MRNLLMRKNLTIILKVSGYGDIIKAEFSLWN